MKALIHYITNANKAEENDTLIMDRSTTSNPDSNHEQENNKALGILKGCTQMKQVKVAFDVFNQMRRERVKVSPDVYNEILKCCLVCSDFKKASYIIQKMSMQRQFPDSDLVDKFLELYNRKDADDSMVSKTNTSFDSVQYDNMNMISNNQGHQNQNQNQNEM